MFVGVGVRLGNQNVLSGLISFVTTTALTSTSTDVALAFASAPQGAIDGTYTRGAATLVVSGGGTVFTFSANGETGSINFNVVGATIRAVVPIISLSAWQRDDGDYWLREDGGKILREAA